MQQPRLSPGTRYTLPKALVVLATAAVALAFTGGSSAVSRAHHHRGRGAVIPRLGRIIPQRLPRFIAYESSSPDGSSSGIFLIKPDGSDSHPVGPLATPYFEPASEPAWSPAATRILYENRGDCTIWIMKANGSQPYRLIKAQRSFDGCNGDNAWPHWSPSGKRIVYVGRGRLTAYNFVRIANADGSHDHLVDNTAGAESASFSPDGHYIVFVNQPADAQTYSPRIYVIRSDGTGLKRLSPPGQEATNPSWSPDGTRITYACSFYRNVIPIPSPGPVGRNAPSVVTPSPPPPPGPHAICEISRTHPKPRKLYSVPSDGSISNPEWSADGKTILALVSDPNFHVALLAPTGRTRSDFTPTGPFSNPDW